MNPTIELSEALGSMRDALEDLETWSVYHGDQGLEDIDLIKKIVDKIEKENHE